MNTGLQDAHNLGWKLALTLRGLAAADLLDSYDAERRPVGRAVVERTTHRMDDSLTERGVKFDQWLEDSQLLINYRSSAWVADDVAASALIGGPRAGDRAPDVPGLRREWVASAQRLAELLRHEGHTVLLYFDRTAAASQYEQAAALADALASAPGDAIAVYGVAHRDARPVDLERFPLLTDADGNFAIAFGADRPCLHVIRPDGYIGYRCDRIDRTALDAYLRRILVPANPH